MLKNFVLETANAPGTSSTFNLGGAASGRLSFSGAGFTNGQVCFYVMDDGTQKEWGIGTFNTGSPNTMTRTTVVKNTSGTTSKLNFSGTTNVYNSLPAEYTAYIDNNLAMALPGALTVAGAGTFTGQLIGGATSTNDDASSAQIGYYVDNTVAQDTHTVTITNASPTVVTWTGHGKSDYSTVFFTTTGALPSGLTAFINYFIKVIDANTFHVATTIANADAGTFVSTSSAGSGTHTGLNSARPSGSTVVVDICGMKLAAGEWDMYANAKTLVDGGTTMTTGIAWISTTSATLPADALAGGSYSAWVGSVIGGGPVLAGMRRRIKLATASLVYLSSDTGFASGAGVTWGGVLAARRPR